MYDAAIRTRRRLVRDTIRRFPGVPKQTLAKYLVSEFPELFIGKDNKADIEKARNSIRYYTGKNGKYLRGKITRAGTLLKHESVQPPCSKAIARVPYRLPEGTWLVICDLHIPYHEPIAINAAVSYAQAQRATGILINGDFQDCAAISPWDASDRAFVEEVPDVIDMLDWIKQEFPKAEIVWKPGNHEDRLHRYYQRFAPKLLGLPTAELEVVLGLEARGIKFLDRKQKILAGKLPILHGHEARGGNAKLVNPARWLMLKTKSSAAVSHFHVSSADNKMNIKDELLSTWSIGCLCDLKPDYDTECNDWNWGFALVHVEKDGNYDFENRRILPGGKIV